MADKGVGAGGRTRPATGRQRIRTLTQAALNADVTVEMVETILTDLGDTLAVLDKTTVGLDTTMDRFNETITRIDELAPRLFGVVDRLEAIVVDLNARSSTAVAQCGGQPAHGEQDAALDEFLGVTGAIASQ
jgi:hypothetical protein